MTRAKARRLERLLSWLGFFSWDFSIPFRFIRHKNTTPKTLCSESAFFLIYTPWVENSRPSDSGFGWA